MTATTLKPQAMDAATRLVSKIISTTRDMTAASGDVSYTGVGFTPTALICLSNVDAGTNTHSIGVADSALAEAHLGRLANGNNYTEALLLTAETSSNNYQTAVVKTFDADGFTLTWAKTNSPTGTLKLTFLCFR